MLTKKKKKNNNNNPTTNHGQKLQGNKENKRIENKGIGMTSKKNEYC